MGRNYSLATSVLGIGIGIGPIPSGTYSSAIVQVSRDPAKPLDKSTVGYICSARPWDGGNRSAAGVGPIPVDNNVTWCDV